MSKHTLLKSSGGKNPHALKTLQGFTLAGKIAHAERKIKEWYEHWEGKVYISFSGGKDSTVLLHLVRSMYPEVPAVFIDTGLEFPEIREFVETFEGVVWVKPKMPFNQVIRKYGYPIISKEQAQYIQQFRSAKSEKTKNTRWSGNEWGRGKISEKWKYLVDAPFLISEKCCDVMKKAPAKLYEKETGRHPIIGTMAVESSKRVQDYNRFGCNAFDNKRPTSKPISTWLEKDIWSYIKLKDLQYSHIYNLGYERTGCVFCAFGCHLNKDNKFDKMKRTHPKLHAHCMDKLGMREVLDWYLDTGLENL